MKYLSVQREKSRKYSQRWQQQHTADELKTIAAAVNYLTEHGISTLDELDAALSSVSEQADTIRAGMKTAEERMKKLQKLIEYGKNYTEYKPVHDELKKLQNGWTNKRDKNEEAHRADQPEQTQTRTKRHDLDRRKERVLWTTPKNRKAGRTRPALF